MPLGCNQLLCFIQHSDAVSLLGYLIKTSQVCGSLPSWGISEDARVRSSV